MKQINYTYSFSLAWSMQQSFEITDLLLRSVLQCRLLTLKKKSKSLSLYFWSGSVSAIAYILSIFFLNNHLRSNARVLYDTFFALKFQ